MKLNFLYRFSKNTEKENLMKTLAVRAELFHYDGRRDVKLIVAFSIFLELA